jgi:hypothetical protein
MGVGKMKIFELLSYWESRGKPSGALYKTEKSEKWSYVDDLFPTIDELVYDDSTKFQYKDPPERWLDIEPVVMLIKLQFGEKIRCRPKPEGIDNIWDEWTSLDGLLVTDIFKFDFQYLSKA